MMVSKQVEGEYIPVSTKVRASIQAMLKSHAVNEGLPLKFFIEAGMILASNKTAAQVKAILDNFSKGDIK